MTMKTIFNHYPCLFHLQSQGWGLDSCPWHCQSQLQCTPWGFDFILRRQSAIQTPFFQHHDPCQGHLEHWLHHFWIQSGFCAKAHYGRLKHQNPHTPGRFIDTRWTLELKFISSLRCKHGSCVVATSARRCRAWPIKMPVFGKMRLHPVMDDH